MASTILLLGLLYFFAHFLSNTFDRSKVPDVLVLIILGIIVGPLLGWTSPDAFGNVGRVLTTVALAVILFEGGTTLNIGDIVRSARSTLQLTLLTSLLTVIIVGVVAGTVLDLPWLSAFILGAIISGTSTAVVIPMLRVLRVRERASTIVVLESAITDVTCIVITVALLQASLQAEMQIGRMVGQALASLVFAAVIGVAGGFGWLMVWQKVREFPTTIFTTLASAFVLYGFTELLGFAGPIAVLAYGITLTNHEQFALGRFFNNRPFSGVTPVESDFYKEIVFLLKTFFFVFLGISIRITDWSLLAAAVAMMMIIFIARLLITPFTVPRTINRYDASVIAVMVPKGLAAAVLSGLPVEAGVAGAEIIQATVYAMVLVSITFTAILVTIKDLPPLVQVFNRVLGDYPETVQDEGPRRTPGPGTPVVP